MDSRQSTRDLAITLVTLLVSATILLATVKTGSRFEKRFRIPPSGAATHAPPIHPDTRQRGQPARLRADRLRSSNSNGSKNGATWTSITPISDWTLQPRMTYDSVGGWWSSRSLGVDVYFDFGMVHLVGRYARAGASESFDGADFRWEIRASGAHEPWIFATVEHPGFVPSAFESNLVTNLASKRNRALDERTQLAHMLWCAMSFDRR